MDFIDFQKAGLQKGEVTEDELRSYDRRTAILNFGYSEGVLTAVLEGEPVYPDPADKAFTEGTWICDVWKSKGVNRATAVRKLDASFFMELKLGQREEIIKALWDEHKKDLCIHFRELYKEQAEQELAKAVEEATKPFKAEIEHLKEEKRDLEQTILANNRLMAANIPKAVPQPVPVQVPVPQAASAAVRRISADMLTSPWFTEPRYFVHVSYDLKTMLVQPHESGTVACVSNTLLLTDLNSVCTFSGDCLMRSEYVEGKGLYVYLK